MTAIVIMLPWLSPPASQVHHAASQEPLPAEFSHWEAMGAPGISSGHRFGNIMFRMLVGACQFHNY